MVTFLQQFCLHSFTNLFMLQAFKLAYISEMDLLSKNNYLSCHFYFPFLPTCDLFMIAKAGGLRSLCNWWIKFFFDMAKTIL